MKRRKIESGSTEVSKKELLTPAEVKRRMAALIYTLKKTKSVQTSHDIRNLITKLLRDSYNQDLLPSIEIFNIAACENLVDVMKDVLPDVITYYIEKFREHGYGHTVTEIVDTPVLCAIENGNIEVLVYLLKQNQDKMITVYSPTQYGYLTITPRKYKLWKNRPRYLDYAIKVNNNAAVDFILALIEEKKEFIDLDTLQLANENNLEDVAKRIWENYKLTIDDISYADFDQLKRLIPMIENTELRKDMFQVYRELKNTDKFR